MTAAALRADALLLLVAVIWGSGFVAQRLGMDHVGPLTFTGVRFAIGTAVLLPIVLRQTRGTRICGPAAPSSDLSDSAGPADPRQAPRRICAAPSAWRGGVVLGLVLFVGAVLQQIGLVTTTAGKAGFITGLYVIFVPLIGLALGRRAGWHVWIGAALAVGGLYLLSVTGRLTMEPGDAFVLACAVVWALHVHLIGRFSPRTDPVRLAAIQFLTTAVLASAAGVIFERPAPRNLWTARWAILYSGVVAVGAGYTLQVVAQRRAPATHAAILLSLEAVFAAVFGGLMLRETLTGRQLVGCVFMLAGVVVSQFRSSRQNHARGTAAARGD